jgi:hypothetical protein
LRFALLADFIAPLVKQVAGALEKKHAKDVFLVFAGIHIAAKVVTGGKQQVFEAGEGEFQMRHEKAERLGVAVAGKNMIKSSPCAC